MRLLSPLLLLLFLLPGASVLSGCDSQQAGRCTSSDAFAIDDITAEGAALGATAQIGSCVTVDYVGRLAATGATFDEGTGFTFPVVTGQGATVIAGFALGVNNQRVGQTRRVTVPPNFGYGSEPVTTREGFADIPSCSTLQFDITLVRVNQDTRLCGL